MVIDGSGNFTFTIGDKADDLTKAGTKSELLTEIQAAITAYDLANSSSPAGITAALNDAATGTDVATVVLAATSLANGAVADPATATAAEYTFSIAANPVANETVTVGGKTYTFVTGTPAAGQVKLGATAALTAANLATVINGDVTNTYSATEAAGTITLKQRVAAAGAVPTVVFAN
ncbi:hypothetical protein [Bacillus sp. FJAT-42315]|uniref:hypothetical protein n=1 Tax=Bacillus sp. FJAT-42315 TaxID=2014077 RepID=UPI000C240BE7|nr:hypothetical protein [Bacillus sp. FJAT-42315]